MVLESNTRDLLDKEASKDSISVAIEEVAEVPVVL